MPEPFRAAVPRLLLPLSAAISMLVVASMEQDPAIAAEAAYLALLATTSLLTTACVAPRLGWIWAALPVLVTAAVWALPGTPDRSAVVSALLVVGCLVAIVCRWRRGPQPDSGVVVASFIGLQLLMKSRLLLEPSVLDLVSLLAWPLVAAIASVVLERHWGLASAASATALAFLVGGGFDAVNALGLLALAAGSLLATGRIGHFGRLTATLVLLAPLLWDRRSGWLLALCGVACVERAAVRVAIAAAALGMGLVLRDATPEPVSLLLLLPLLLPAPVIEPARSRALKAVALVLAVASWLAGLGTAVLATPIALLALTLRRTSRALVHIQAAWIGALAAAALLLATPPWLREDRLSSALGLFTLQVDVRSTILVLAAATLLWLYARLASLTSSSRAAASMPLAITFALAAALLPRLPNDSLLLITKQAVVLTADSDWSRQLESPSTVREIVIDSALANSTDRRPGSIFGLVEAEGPAGANRWQLRVGVESGEWAALRPDVESIAGLLVPSPHLSRVDATGTFFAQRYRTVLELPRPTEISKLYVRLAEDMPNLTFSISHLELRR